VGVIVDVSIVDVARSSVGENVTVRELTETVVVHVRVAVGVFVKLAVTIVVPEAVGVNPAGVVVPVRDTVRVTFTDGVGVIVIKNIPVAATRVAAIGSMVAPYAKSTAVLVGTTTVAVVIDSVGLRTMVAVLVINQTPRSASTVANNGS
jgi:hypothetical protein